MMTGSTRMMVLVVDDDPISCALLRSVLGKKGYEVGVSRTGEEAIASVKEKAPDIVFIDMMLPTIDGLETYLCIREIEPKAVAIMVTAYREEMADLMNQAIENSAYTCLYKPFDMNGLVGLVDDISRRKWDMVATP